MSFHILLIDDNPGDIELTLTAFEEMHIAGQFTIFKDGDLAIAGCQRMMREGSSIPDLALLDLNLTRSSGHQVLMAIRAEPLLADMPVLVLTTSDHAADRARCLAEGASDYLVKPPRFDQLLELIEKIRRQWLVAKP